MASARIGIPADLAAIDADWLSAVLAARVLAVSPGAPTEGIAVTSRVARLRLTSAQDAPAPTAVVVKVANPQWTYGSELHAREVSFYRDFAPHHTLPVPRCFYADFDPDTGAFVLVLEDLGDLVPGHRLDGLNPVEAEAVVDGLADLHRTWWLRDEVRALPQRGHEPERIAETLATLDQRWHALEACGKYAIDDGLRALLPVIRARYAAGMHAISSHPQTLIHSDLHVENFFLEQTDAGLRLIAIDWQNASFGHCAFDLSSALSSVKPELVHALHAPLLARYHVRLARPDYTAAQLTTDVAAAVRHQFIGSANWFATTEAETMRDAATIQGHWTRLCATLIATEAA